MAKAKAAKYQGEFKDQRGQGVTQYHPWILAVKEKDEKTRSRYLKIILDYMLENPHQRELAKEIKKGTRYHVIGFAPYAEYMKHKAEGAFDLEGVYLHAFGNPALLVFDKKTKSLMIVGPEIDFSPDMGIRG